MKYRRLSNEELKELEPEFIEFLASNSVTGDDWVKLKKESNDKAEEMIEIFSDIVLERALTKIECLEKRDEKDWKIFYCTKEQIHLIGLAVPVDSELDLRKEISTTDLFDEKVEIYAADKTYTEGREIEMFKMIESGCTIGSIELFNMMTDLMEQSE